MREVAVSPGKYSRDAAGVEEHEEGSDRSNHTNDVLDTRGEGGEDGGEEEPQSDGGEAEFFVTVTEWE